MKFLKKIKEYTHAKPKTKKIIGIVTIIVGFIMVMIPIVPGLWLVVFGLELLGMEILFFDKAVKFFTEMRGAKKISTQRVAFAVLACVLAFYWYNVFLIR